MIPALKGQESVSGKSSKWFPATSSQPIPGAKVYAAGWWGDSGGWAGRLWSQCFEDIKVNQAGAL